MKFYIGITDNNWFAYLNNNQASEANFWRPGGGGFHVLAPGELFLWKLHKSKFIVGGGFFERSSKLPLSLAWEVFGSSNGASDFLNFSKAVRGYSKKNEEVADPFIGCIALTGLFFLPQEDWIPFTLPTGIMQGKGYDSEEVQGKQLWDQVQVALLKNSAREAGNLNISKTAIEAARFGHPRMIAPRLGQGGFRIAVTESYRRRCAMTGEKTLPVLEAAHIRPFANEGPHLTSNGLLLRADLHTLFDRGFITVTADNRIEVSQQIKETYGNGRHYYALHGQKLQILPKTAADRPSPEFVEWHNSHVFRP